ncbi:hypothetical protein WA026_004683 [Henosepilachna vigintioctopunctata]|uniref:ZZ-type domain-containing protein n=1 Tax=Henosepilachna vigintioctopunctata TaxID=420089 RepID=A0AAW1V7A6_9CUCU
MASSGINFKVYAVIGDNTEVKRFFVDSGAVTSFVFMKEKIKSVFPNLKEMDFKMSWKDADGDYISITNDEDFITALTELSDNPKVLYVNAELRNASEENARMYWVLCDVCQKAIIGYRYKCIECPDYDLCSTCEGNGHHSEHMVLRLPNSNTPIAKVDRKMMYNAARALKKSACNVAKQAHKCARESFKAAEKEKHSNEGAEIPTCAQNSVYECPFSTSELSEMFSQNMTPFIEMLSKGASNLRKEQETTPQNPLSDIVRSVAEAFTGFVNPEASAKSSTSQNSDTVPPPTTSTTSQKPQPAAPTAPAAENTTNSHNQEMDWTLVNDSEESVSQENASSQTSTPQPPPPPQDTRLMKGLAQLYEMGFSNENQFLNYMLEAHNYNVGDVVKAILEMK